MCSKAVKMCSKAVKMYSKAVRMCSKTVKMYIAPTARWTRRRRRRQWRWKRRSWWWDLGGCGTFVMIIFYDEWFLRRTFHEIFNVVTIQQAIQLGPQRSRRKRRGTAGWALILHTPNLSKIRWRKASIIRSSVFSISPNSMWVTLAWNEH